MEEETYLVDEETGDQYRLGGFIPSEEESDLPKFSASRKYGSSQLPPGVDLRQFMTPVEHQLTLNSWLVALIFSSEAIHLRDVLLVLAML